MTFSNAGLAGSFSFVMFILLWCNQDYAFIFMFIIVMVWTGDERDKFWDGWKRKYWKFHEMSCSCIGILKCLSHTVEIQTSIWSSGHRDKIPFSLCFLCLLISFPQKFTKMKYYTAHFLDQSNYINHCVWCCTYTLKAEKNIIDSSVPPI